MAIKSTMRVIGFCRVFRIIIPITTLSCSWTDKSLALKVITNPREHLQSHFLTTQPICIYLLASGKAEDRDRCKGDMIFSHHLCKDSGMDIRHVKLDMRTKVEHQCSRVQYAGYRF